MFDTLPATIDGIFSKPSFAREAACLPRRLRTVIISPTIGRRWRGLFSKCPRTSMSQRVATRVTFRPFFLASIRVCYWAHNPMSVCGTCTPRFYVGSARWDGHWCRQWSANGVGCLSAPGSCHQRTAMFGAHARLLVIEEPRYMVCLEKGDPFKAQYFLGRTPVSQQDG